MRDPLSGDGIEEHTNFADSRNAFLTTNLIEQGFYQVMSPQTLIFRVMTLFD